jgi:hypothetical protein
VVIFRNEDLKLFNIPSLVTRYQSSNKDGYFFFLKLLIFFSYFLFLELLLDFIPATVGLKLRSPQMCTPATVGLLAKKCWPNTA